MPQLSMGYSRATQCAAECALTSRAHTPTPATSPCSAKLALALNSPRGAVVQGHHEGQLHAMACHICFTMSAFMAQAWGMICKTIGPQGLCDTGRCQRTGHCGHCGIVVRSRRVTTLSHPS